MRINYDNKLFAVLTSLFDHVLVGFLWMVCSIPIITLGASTSAAFSVLLGVDKSSGSIIRGFFASFKSCFKQATAVWCVLLAAGALIAANVMACSRIGNDSVIGIMFRGTAAIVTLCYLLSVSLMFPVIAKFRVKLSQLLHNVLYYAVQKPGLSLLMMLLGMLIFLGIYVFYAFGFVTAGVLLYLQSIVFKKLNPDYFLKESDLIENE